MDPLKLMALDRDDLEIVSTHLQDAVVKVADVMWRPAENRMVVGLNRFDWEGAACGTPHYQRRRSVLRFDRVVAVKCRNVCSADKSVVLNLLAVEFEETNAPGGVVTFIFSGGAALRLEVECIECELADLGPVWPTTICPAHAAEVIEAKTA